MIHSTGLAVRLLPALILSLFLCGPVWAGHGTETKTLNTDQKGVAIGGYDPVAYFTNAKATPGSTEFEYAWRDAAWHFATAEHRALFISDPEKYAPQYGAFCALGVSFNKAVPADPEAWTIVDGKLYLNYNLDYRDKWRAEKNAHIKKADMAWSEHAASQ